MLLTDYIKQCLQNPEFKKYWEEDGLPLVEGSDKISSELTISQALQKLSEAEQDPANDYDSLIKNHGIKSENSKMTVEFYEIDSVCPVLEFLESIKDEKLKEKTVKNIYGLSTLGLDMNKTGNSGYVSDGMYELRTKQGTNIDRIFYFFVVGNKIILTNGYIKKSQKLDRVEFLKAKKFRDEYSRR